ncbi:MAG: tetratricopeptide repeat protein [Patescibacteria group bacterium]
MQESTKKDFSFKSLFVPLTPVKVAHYLVIIGFLVFGNMLFNSFVADDITLILTNPTIHSLSNFSTLLFQIQPHAGGQGLFTGSYYIPLTLISFSSLYTFFGDTPFFFHFFQLLLHIANAILLFSIFTSFFSKRIALFLSLLFLVHPINQESVAYIANLQEVLFLFWGLLALFYYQKFRKDHISWKTITIVSAFIFLSLLAKVTGVLFIPLILLLVFISHKKHFFYFLIGFGITLGVYFLLKSSAQQVLFAVEPSSITQANLATRLLNIPAIIFYYIGTFFFPKTLITHQDWLITSVTVTSFYIPLLLDLIFFACLGVLGIISSRVSKKTFSTFLFFSLWFVLGLLLHAQIIPLDFTVADRWFYFPIVGLLGVIAVAIQMFKINPKVFVVVGLIIVVILSIRTIVRNANWRNGYSLYTHDLVFAQDNVYLNGLLGNEYMNMRKYDEALLYFNKVATIKPLQERNWINIGASYYSKGDLKSAEKYFKKASEVGRLQTKYDRLGLLYITEGRLKEARMVYQTAVKEYPMYQRAQLYLAYCEYKLGNKEKALELATKAYQTAPSNESQYVLTQITNGQEIKIQ